MRSNNMSKYRIFTKTPWDRKSAAYYILLALVSIFYAAFLDGSRIDIIAYSPKDWALLATSAGLYCLPLFFLLMLSRWAFLICTPILFYIGSIGRIYASEYFLNTHYKTAPLFFDNTVVSSIAKNPENAAFIAIIFVSGLVAGFVRFLYARDTSTTRKGQAFAVILILAGAATAFVRESYPDFTPQPYAYIGSMQKYATERMSDLIFKTARTKSEAIAGDNVTGVIIFIDKLSNDSAYMNKNDMLISRQFSQNFGSQRHNLLSALTGAGKEQPKGLTEFPTILSDFKNAGYETAWFTAYNQFIMPDKYINKMAKTQTAKHLRKTLEPGNETSTYRIKANEGSPNPFLAMDSLKKFAKNNTKGLFVISIDGTAPKISERYDDIFHTGKEPETDVEKAYANYTCQLEALVSETAVRLKGKEAFIIIAGLAGEEISDNNDFKKNTFQPADSILGLWLSPELKAKLDVEKISEKLKEQTTPDMVYHTALGCAGIKSESIDGVRNLCK